MQEAKELTKETVKKARNSAMGNIPTSHTNKVALLIIDPQIDFHPGGTMPIDGAEKDSERTAAMIRTYCDEIDEIYVSISSILIDIQNLPLLDSILSHTYQ